MMAHDEVCKRFTAAEHLGSTFQQIPCLIRHRLSCQISLFKKMVRMT